MNDNGPSNESTTWYVLLILAVLVVAVAGYAGYVLYPRFDLPAVSGSGLLVLASAAGLASFFSPCAFPLLLTLLARETGAEPGESRSSLARALGFGLSLSVGAAAFLLVVGSVIALGGGPLFARVTFTSLAGQVIRTVVGTVLVVLGLIQLGIVPVSFHGIEGLARPMLETQAAMRRRRPYLSFALFGFVYWIAGFG